MHKILVINPGSTSTKVSIYENNNLLSDNNIEHNSKELKKYHHINDQIEMRKQKVLDFINANGYVLNDFSAIATRGGILPPLNSGTYLVEENMIKFLKYDYIHEHASNLAAIIGYEISEGKIPVYVTDPISVDEFIPESRISGIPDIERISLVHSLNMKSVARKAAKELGKDYNTCNFILVHLGGGISVGAQSKGKIIDVNNANDEGPFSPDRSGDLPMNDLVKKIYMNKSNKSLKKRYTSKSGMYAYLGTNDLRKAFKMAESDNKAKIIIDAMAYQIAKEIGGMATVLKGNIDAIVITGGMANSNEFVLKIKERISKLGLIMVYPGSHEMEALAEGALRVINKSEEALKWRREEVK